jgi:hypothetical protein
MSSERVGLDLRHRVAERANGCCEYCLCQSHFSPSPFSVEHIIPRSMRGKTVSSNLALVCQGCNNHKFRHTTGIDPITREEFPLYNPRLDIWSEHFAWTSNFEEIAPLSAKGRATLLRLNLNRPEIVALRRILTVAGFHPPDYPYRRLNA